MTQYSIYNQTLHHLNPEAEAWSVAAFDEVEKHACVQALHCSYIRSLSQQQKTDLIADQTLHLPVTFFEEALAELSKQLDESEAESLAGAVPSPPHSLIHTASPSHTLPLICENKYAGIRVLGMNTSLLLAMGGDDRLTLQMDAGKTNKYHASPFVRPGITYRGSCTCSTITAEVNTSHTHDTLLRKTLFVVLLLLCCCY